KEGGPKDGYRCLKLSTGRGPVRVRLVDQNTQEFLNRLHVKISHTDDFKGSIAEGTTTNGLFEAAGPFQNVAFVRVYAFGNPLVEFPVPLVDDRTTVCRMLPTKAALAQGEVEQRKDRWVRGCVEALSLTDQRLGELDSNLGAKAVLQMARQHQETIAG